MVESLATVFRTLRLDEHDALILVPPFCELNYPSLGAHVVQACARAAGFRIGVLYTNLLFGSTIGSQLYGRICGAFRGSFLGERLFARTAYGVPPLGERAREMFALDRIFGMPVAEQVYPNALTDAGVLLGELESAEERVPDWVEAVAEQVATLGVKVIGATTTFEQTGAAVALLRAIKRRAPATIVVVGGANCEGEMAQGVLSIAPFLDHVFSGESEETFPAFLRAVRAGEPPPGRVVLGTPCRDMDAIPQLDYADYHEQRAAFLDQDDLATLGPPLLPYETSRGCWWGEKHHCTFCGLNGQGMGFRARSPDRVLGELQALTAAYGTKEVLMADNIMPHSYFNTVLPRLAEELPGLNIFYEQKANLTLEQLQLLKRAGIGSIQPGIEALSSELLMLMRKGITARQNIALLRDSRAVELCVIWNLLWGFPRDSRSAYEETLETVRTIPHLQPPGGFWPVMFDRFSPYFEQHESFGIQRRRPFPGYTDYLPAGAPVEQLAYHFTGDFEAGSTGSPELMRDIQLAVESWKTSWARPHPPEFRIVEYRGMFARIDTRGLAPGPTVELLDARETWDLIRPARDDGSALQRSLVERKVALHLDGWFVPLAVVAPSVRIRVAREVGASTDVRRLNVV